MARHQQRRYPIGSVSSGTMQTDDLIPTFCSELSYQARQPGILNRKRRAEHAKLVREIEARAEGEGYYESDDADEDLDSLFEALGEYAGPYFSFGSHPGDGADYGFWLDLGFEEAFDGLKVGDLADVPARYRGEVLEVNDHGNCTLYVQTSRGLREIWAVV